MRCVVVHDLAWKDFDKRLNVLANSINAKAPWLALSIVSKRLCYPATKAVPYKKGSSIKIIDGDWFDREITDRSYDMTCLLVDTKQSRLMGIKNVHGMHYTDADRYHETWVVADEDQKKTVKDGKRRKLVSWFEETFEHELKHALYYQFGKTDRVHEFNLDGIPDEAWKELNLYAQQAKPVAVVSKWGLLPAVDRKATALIENLKAKGIEIRITEGLRTFERQQALWDQGRTKPGSVVTNAMPGYSFHNHGVAFDVVPKEGYNVSNARWEAIGAAGEALGLSWGGRWKGFVDKPHFELSLGHSIEQFATQKVDLSKFS